MALLSSAIIRDTIGNQPSANAAGRLFISTDENKIYRDNGSTWDEILIDASGTATLDQLFLTDGTELTISSAEITVTKARHTVDTESDASSDDLDTISGVAAGEVFVLSPANGARTVVLKNGSDNIICATGADITLDDITDAVLCYGVDGTNVLAIPFQGLGVSSVDASAVTYTPTTLTDWDSDADPGDLDDALDQLAERVDDLEGVSGVGGTLGATDNAIPRADGTGGSTLQASGLTINDSDTLEMADNVIERAEMLDYSETVATDTDSGATHTIDITTGNVHQLTLTANCTLTFSNPSPTGKACSFTLIVTQDGTGSRTLTYPASVDWAGGSAPTLTTDANAVDILTFLTTDAGTTWYGFPAGLDFS